MAGIFAYACLIFMAIWWFSSLKPYRGSAMYTYTKLIEVYINSNYSRYFHGVLWSHGNFGVSNVTFVSSIWSSENSANITGRREGTIGTTKHGIFQTFFIPHWLWSNLCACTIEKSRYNSFPKSSNLTFLTLDYKHPAINNVITHWSNASSTSELLFSTHGCKPCRMRKDPSKHLVPAVSETETGSFQPC